MKRIKTFRLFESVNRLESRIKEISDIYEDVRSIIYILEDDGYDLHWKILTEHSSYNIEGNISDLIRYHSFSGEGSVFHNDFLKPVTIRINVSGKDGKPFEQDDSNKSDYTSDISRFMDILEEHLNYLPSDLISVEDFVYVYKIEINI